MSITVVKFDWHGDKTIATIRSKGNEALRDAGEYLLEQANRTVPHDEGTLMRSGMVTVGDGEAIVSYSTPYAVRLHENPQYNFQRGRRGKWLELTLREQQQSIAQHIARKLAL